MQKERRFFYYGENEHNCKNLKYECESEYIEELIAYKFEKETKEKGLRKPKNVEPGARKGPPFRNNRFNHEDESNTASSVRSDSK